MEWLTPLTALYAAAVSLPLLLLLYFLKLKRKEEFISSTLLWKRAIQDLQVNAPFQKIRRNLLLLIQLLMLLVILTAIAGPILSLASGPSRRFVLLIDRSASMSAVDIKPTRLDEAKKQVLTFIESIRGKDFFSLRDEGDHVMVICFDDHAKVMCNFTSDKHQLRLAIEAITAGDGGSSLLEAITAARAFAQSPGTEANNRSSEKAAQLILYSDGNIRDAQQLAIAKDELIFNSIGTSRHNIAITAMQAKRSYENPDAVNVFATISNYDTNEAMCDVQLSVNANVQTVRTIKLPAEKDGKGGASDEPGNASIDFTLPHAESGVLELRQLKADALGSDDVAWAVLPSPRKLTALLVTQGNAVLESALKSCVTGKLEICRPADFEKMDVGKLSIEQPYDVIILDNYAPANFPRGRYLVFGQPPSGIDVSVSGQLENQVIADWRPKHLVLQYVNLANLFAAKCYKMNLPNDAEILAEFNGTAAMAIVRRGGSVFLLAGFDVLQTNWPFEPSFILFCYNSTAFLGMQIPKNQEVNFKVSEPIIVEGFLPETTVDISGPAFVKSKVKANTAGTIRFPGTDRVGVYGLKASDKPMKLFAINLLDFKESDIRPRSEISLSGEMVKAQNNPSGRSNLPLWPYLVGIALALGCLEWIIYNSRVRI